jgi:lysophospholipid acyltransferase (LPLAT)-like uncharacterized protein
MRALSYCATLWVRSLRPRFSPSRALPTSGILVLWHADMLPCLRAFAGRSMRVLISSSRDGDFGAAAATRLGYRVVRGSSSRGGAPALLQIARELNAQGGWVALVVDGPRGPRGVCKPGAVWLSQACGLPIVGVTAGAPHGFTLGGWAQVRVPWPLTKVTISISQPFSPKSTIEIENVLNYGMWEVDSGK